MNFAENALNPAQNRSYSIHEITRIVDERLSIPSLQNIAIVGEITEYRRHASSGHIYFTLADKETDLQNSQKKAILKCTFFRRANMSMNFEPKVGDEVQIIGSISLYYQGGQYNFNVRTLQKVGAGNLFLRIQELRQKLLKEGVIDPSLKKPLPRLPQKIGLVTGMNTAALKDILKQAADRYPHVNILIAPALMQGNEAPDSITAALDEISQEKYSCDVIILSRGGGSAEDLIAFNDEKVARAIFKCPLPVISGIGHQIDHPISDDVADLAAATPTDAAKIALPVVRDLLLSLQGVKSRLDQNLQKRFEVLKEKLQRISDKPFFKEPSRLLEEYDQKIDDLEIRLAEAFRDKLKILSDSFHKLPDILYLFSQILSQSQNKYARLEEKLAAFSPLATLKRGYSISYQNGKILRSVQSLNKTEEVEIKLHDGNFWAKPKT